MPYPIDVIWRDRTWFDSGCGFWLIYHKPLSESKLIDCQFELWESNQCHRQQKKHIIIHENVFTKQILYTKYRPFLFKPSWFETCVRIDPQHLQVQK